MKPSDPKAPISGYHLPSILPPSFSPGLPEEPDTSPQLPSKASIDDTNALAASGLKNGSPYLHLVIPASETNANLCKTLLSTFILDYPPPTLINYGKNFSGDGWDKGTHTGKIRGIYDFLTNPKLVDDQDLVLVIDGYDIWFQLPPEVLIKRYHSSIASANKRLRKKYGTRAYEKDGQTPRPLMYSQTVIYAADKLCWPNPAEDPACTAIPPSTLPMDAYGADTDRDSQGFLNRPRYLNSGAAIGPASDLRALFGRATEKVERYGRGELGDQFVFSEIFGEQEYVRETIRVSRQSAGGRWLTGLSNALGLSKTSSSITMNNLTVIHGQRYEYALGLDYESQLFQTLTHSHGDIDFLYYNDTHTLAHVQEQHHIPAAHPLFLPLDIQRATPPLAARLPVRTEASGTLAATPYLDSISTNLSWSSIPLATNAHVPSIPTLLHFNGDKSYLSTWWTKMWYQPESRALLRRYMRSSRGSVAAHVTAAGGNGRWETRGGRGGVWTDTAQWFEWDEICKGYEDELFMDGKGTWGKEVGVKKIYNSFGKLIEGVADEDEE